MWDQCVVPMMLHRTWQVCLQRINPQSIEAVTDPHAGAPADGLDDATIDEGGEHRRQISGAPQASMMCVENLESFR